MWVWVRVRVKVWVRVRPSARLEPQLCIGTGNGRHRHRVVMHPIPWQDLGLDKVDLERQRVQLVDHFYLQQPTPRAFHPQPSALTTQSRAPNPEP